MFNWGGPITLIFFSLYLYSFKAFLHRQHVSTSSPETFASSLFYLRMSTVPDVSVIDNQFPMLQDNELKTYLAANVLSGIALDIDETLSWTVGHWLDEMIALFGNPENLTAKDMAIKYKLAQNVPYWQNRPEVDEWMKSRRVDNDMQKHISLIPDAKECVDTIVKNGVSIVAYLTVRPQCVLQGTQEWLLSRGFPNAPIVGKPDSVPFELGNTWKAELLPTLYPQVLGLVDDNPNVMKALDSNYKGKLYLFSHDNDIVPDTHKSCVSAHMTWKEVEKDVLLNLNNTI